MATIPLVEFEVFRDELGVAATDPAVDRVSRLLDAVSFRIRRLAQREFEGDDGGSYDETYRLDGQRLVILRHVPVRAISAVYAVSFDGTEELLSPDEWRLESAERGTIRIRRRVEYLRVVYTTTGEIPASIPQAALDWGRARWADRDRIPALAGYHTGEDAETYFAAIAGKPPLEAAQAIYEIRHEYGGGPV